MYFDDNTKAPGWLRQTHCYNEWNSVYFTCHQCYLVILLKKLCFVFSRFLILFFFSSFKLKYIILLTHLKDNGIFHYCCTVKMKISQNIYIIRLKLIDPIFFPFPLKISKEKSFFFFEGRGEGNKKKKSYISYLLVYMDRVKF